MFRRIDRRRFLEVASLGAAVGVAGCEEVSDDEPPPERGDDTEQPEDDTVEGGEAKYRLIDVEYPKTITDEEEFKITAKIENVGDATDSRILHLEIDDLSLTEEIELAPGTTETVEITIDETLDISKYSFSITIADEEVRGEFEVHPSVVDVPWEQLPGPQGGPITQLDVSPADPQYIYAATRTAGIYASADGGESWIQAPGARHHERRIFASPHDPQIARTDWNRTDDGGYTWYDFHFDQEELRKPRDRDLGILDVAFDPFDEQILFAATSDGVYRTTDQGLNWHRLEIDGYDSTNQVDALTVHPKLEGVVLAAMRHQAAIVSEDRGETWSTVPGSEDVVTHIPRGVTFGSPDSNKAYITGDILGVWEIGEGDPHQITSEWPSFQSFWLTPQLPVSADWERLYFVGKRDRELDNSELELFEYHMSADEIRTIGIPELPSAITTHPHEPETLYLGGWAWVYKSENLGTSWRKLPSGFIDRHLTSVAANPSNPGTVFTGSTCSGGLFASYDHGETHEWKRSGLSPYHDGEWAEHYVLETATLEDRAYVTTAAGLLFSSDNGQTWMLLENEFSGKGGLDGERTPLHGVAVDPSDPEIVYVGNGRDTPGGSGSPVFDGSFIWKSTDGGQTWDQITDGFPSDRETVVREITVSHHDRNTVYVTTHKNDKRVHEHSPTEEHEGGEGLGLYRSTNAGAEWERIPTPIENIQGFAEDPVDRDQLYISNLDGVFRTTDGGENWEQILPYESLRLLAHPQKRDVVFAGAKKYPRYWDLLVSVDGGETWIEANLTIQIGREPDSREYDGIQLHGDYRNDNGQIMGLSYDPSTSYLYAATEGAGLFRGDIRDLGDL